MPLMPMLATGVPGAVPGPTTNLNIGMDYWVAPASSAIAPTGQISAAAVTGSTIPSTLVGASEKVPSELWLQVVSQLALVLALYLFFFIHCEFNIQGFYM